MSNEGWTSHRHWKWLAGLLAGTALAGSCSSEQVNAVLAGVEVAVEELNRDDDDISFRDWLRSELDD